MESTSRALSLGPGRASGDTGSLSPLVSVSAFSIPSSWRCTPDVLQVSPNPALTSKQVPCPALATAPLFPTWPLSAHCAAVTGTRPSAPGSETMDFCLPSEGGWSGSLTDKETLRQFPEINRGLPTWEEKKWRHPGRPLQEEGENVRWAPCSWACSEIGSFAGFSPTTFFCII